MKLSFSESVALRPPPKTRISFSDEARCAARKRQRFPWRSLQHTRKQVITSLQHPDLAKSSADAFVTDPSRDLDLCVCHKSADFDSFAAAVGLALLRGPGAKVLLPGGEHPALSRYLSLHRSLFPFIDLKQIDAERVRYIGVVDAHQKKRIGAAADLLLQPGLEVEVFDHHQHGMEDCDIEGASLTFAPVGAVTTLIVERLRVNRVRLSAAEATILAIAIHADTGNLTYENTTPRDVTALAWLLEQGACQRSISTFAREYLSPDQQRLLTACLDSMVIQEVKGTTVASCLLESVDFVSGSGVAQVAMELSNVDAFLLAIATPASRKARRAAAAVAASGLGGGQNAGSSADGSEAMRVSIIGRARSRVEAVDFASLFAPLGGGGHAKAASATVKVESLSGAQECVQKTLSRFCDVLPEPIRVGSFMSKDVVSVLDSDTMQTAQDLLFEWGHTGLAVVTKGNLGKLGRLELAGVISRQDVARAERKGLLDTKVKGWTARQAITVAEDTPLFEAERMLALHKIGRLPVVRDGAVVGIVTRSDVLRQRQMI
jgi:tRNA nucleotidyltransferase (CCA-adding enzyme)